ncbi:MAG TPA: hypothetical protein VK797_04435 [Tepidisphaeraceae bacterium]|jgi:hypothetical protein|nr:hypothetical protein [Tepidisphaeraceae bacterium]
MELIANKGSTTVLQAGAIYVLVEIDGRWRLRNRAGQTYSARGRFNFVRQGGRFLVSKRGEHIHLSRGWPVEYAGEIRFGYNKARGRVKSWSNASGHYRPDPALAPQAGLSMELFVPIEVL